MIGEAQLALNSSERFMVACQKLTSANLSTCYQHVCLWQLCLDVSSSWLKTTAAVCACKGIKNRPFRHWKWTELLCRLCLDLPHRALSYIGFSISQRSVGRSVFQIGKGENVQLSCLWHYSAQLIGFLNNSLDDQSVGWKSFEEKYCLAAVLGLMKIFP